MIKYKYNTTYSKWVCPWFFLIFNLCFFAVKPDDDKIPMICFGISLNSLALLTFVLLCIFPRTYYCFDEDGITYYSRKGELKWGVLWRDIIQFGPFWIGGDLTCMMEYRKGDGKTRRKKIHISYRQYWKIYDNLNLKGKLNNTSES